MKVQVGQSYKSRSGEVFGPLQPSGTSYAHPYFAVKFGQVFTFSADGRYLYYDATSRTHPKHVLDLVAPK